MIRRLLMFLIGVIVGLAIGHAIGYQQRQKDDADTIFLYKQIVNSVKGKR